MNYKEEFICIKPYNPSYFKGEKYIFDVDNRLGFKVYKHNNLNFTENQDYKDFFITVKEYRKLKLSKIL